MAHLLNAQTKHQQLLKDSTELIKDVDGMMVNRNAWLLTFDVNNLFPNVETAEAVDMCAKGGRRCEREKWSEIS
jgi:hypothetical protein